ncbi:hypothetical protein MYAM1_002073 [Malassezia yamatoensis]|uniref:G-patch domain-containing protein n=1 Tax=Malassezia yamatoensis TaxID=253288 RepID=A0AAJ6CGZ0_9BASI|nr:hypothetical protein MYAM1_002073 [Malassezia yamatoensis]
MSDYDPMYPNDYTQYTSLLNKQHDSYTSLQPLDQQDDHTETDHDYAHRFRKFAPPAFYSQGTAARGSSREPVQQVKTPEPPGPPPRIPSQLLKPGGPEQSLGTAPGPAPPRPQSLAARDSESRPESSDANDQPDALAASLPTSPVRNTLPQESGAHNFAERLMEKYGYKKGQGLGSEGNKGIINPLEMLKAQKGAPRGTIVNRDQDEAAIARDQYGEPSDVIVLSSALDLELHLSSELSQEIAGRLEERDYETGEQDVEPWRSLEDRIVHADQLRLSGIHLYCDDADAALREDTPMKSRRYTRSNWFGFKSSLVPSEATRDFCARERTYLAWVKFYIYMMVLSSTMLLDLRLHDDNYRDNETIIRALRAELGTANQAVPMLNAPAHQDVFQSVNPSVQWVADKVTNPTTQERLGLGVVYLTIACAAWVIALLDYFDCINQLETFQTYLDECEGHTSPMVTILSGVVALIIMATVLLMIIQREA